MWPNWSRFGLVVLAIVLFAIIPLTNFARVDRIFAVVGGVLSALAGIIALRDHSEDPRFTSRAVAIVRVWRRLMSSDRLVAMLLFSLGAISTAGAALTCP